jgi:magnesium transporter
MPSKPFEVPHLPHLYTSPDTLAIAEDAVPTSIVVTDYSPSMARCFVAEAPEALADLMQTDTVTWVDVRGLGDRQTLERIGQTFNLHPLALADIVNVPQRPKLEEFDDYDLTIVQMVVALTEGFHSEQVSIVIGHHYVLTFQEEPKVDCFEPVRDRIRHAKGTIRHQNADYLAYALLDAIIDGFFPVLEAYGERLEVLEIETAETPTRQTLGKIHKVKRDLLALRRAIWPLRDAINALMREDATLISDSVRPYLRDCYDHAVQAIDLTEIYRELTSGLVDLYLSAVSNRTNAVVNLLTVVSTVFIPLTFIVGVYGMNFDPDASRWNMPELDWPYGYPLVWAIMLAIGGSLLFFFWRKGWLGDWQQSGRR